MMFFVSRMCLVMMLSGWVGICVGFFPSPPQSTSETPPPPNAPRTVEQAPLIAFDCNMTEPEIVAISALDVGPCPLLSSFKPVVTTIFGQLIQRHFIEHVHIRTCQWTKTTTLFLCGKNWLNYGVYPGSHGIVKYTTATQCNIIHTVGYFKWDPDHRAWTDLIANTTSHLSVNQVGWTSADGYCQGGSYTVNGMTHENVVVQTSMLMSVRDSYGTVNYETGTLNIEGGVSCAFSKGTCNDAKTGTHVWTPAVQKCPDDEYRLLYQGEINITTSKQDVKQMMSISNSPFLFTSELGVQSYVCTITLFMTEFPEIFLIKQRRGEYQMTFDAPGNLDIKLITYLNAKLTYAYHTLLDSAREQYLDAIQQTCRVEREMFKNRIEIIRLNSAAGGMSSLLQPGMFAKANGEVIHLIKCTPVPVTFRNTPDCYSTLPVIHKGDNMFMLPITHILSPYGTVIPCSTITPVSYKLGGQWWSFTGHFLPITSPKVLQPDSKYLPEFTRVKAFGQGGMYSKEQVEAVQKIMIFPSLRDAITSDMVDGITNFNSRQISLDMTSLLSDADWENVAQKHLERFWGIFSAFGSAVSGMFGVYIAIKVLCVVVKSILNCRDLYRVFGLSFRLLGAFWTGLSQAMLNSAHWKRTQKQDGEKAEPRTDPPTAPPAEPAVEENNPSEAPQVYSRRRPYRSVCTAENLDLVMDTNI